MLETFWAMYTSMPLITDMTAIRVVVARMMPSSVRKLRSLLPRRDWTAPITASQNEACVFIYSLDESLGDFVALWSVIHSIIASSAQRRRGLHTTFFDGYLSPQCLD